MKFKNVQAQSAAAAAPQNRAVVMPPQQQMPQPPSQPPSSTAGAPAQLSAANLEQQQAALKQAQPPRRQNIKPPAAPTAGPGQFQHPFVSSPQGVPLYEGQPAVTQVDLKFPPKKKQKTSKEGQVPSAASTPARATPGLTASPTFVKAGFA